MCPRLPGKQRQPEFFMCALRAAVQLPAGTSLTQLIIEACFDEQQLMACEKYPAPSGNSPPSSAKSSEAKGRKSQDTRTYPGKVCRH